MPPRPRPIPNGRFDLIPPGAERRLAELFERDASTFGPRDWESGIPLSTFMNMARDALNRLHARDTSDDWAARATWAMFGYMHVEAQVRAGRLPAELADMPAPDPIVCRVVSPEITGEVTSKASLQPPKPPEPPPQLEVPVPPPYLPPSSAFAADDEDDEGEVGG